jgi:hypothetical protein
MEQAQEKNLKTPPESDPRKENRVPADETPLGPEHFDNIRPKDDGTLKPINIHEETPPLVGN